MNRIVLDNYHIRFAQYSMTTRWPRLNNLPEQLSSNVNDKLLPLLPRNALSGIQWL